MPSSPAVSLQIISSLVCDSLSCALEFAFDGTERTRRKGRCSAETCLFAGGWVVVVVAIGNGGGLELAEMGS